MMRWQKNCIWIQRIFRWSQPKQNVMNKVIATMSAVFAPFVYSGCSGTSAGGVDPGQYGSSIFCRNWDVCGIEFLCHGRHLHFFRFLLQLPHPSTLNVNTFIAVLCCCALVNRTGRGMAARIADGEAIRFLGSKLSETTYTSTVLPPLLLVWVLSIWNDFRKETARSSKKNC